MSDKTMQTSETTQPWVVYTYGRTHDKLWPFWNSTRVLGRCCIICECAVCGDRLPLWMRIPRFGPVIDKGHHPKRNEYLAAHRHPDRGSPMSWARPLLNPGAHRGGLNLDALAMRLETDLNFDHDESSE
jgi:hypothetical protein